MATRDDPATSGRSNSEVYQDVACPFCGIICDDLEIARSGDILEVRKNGCNRAVAGFQRAVGNPSPQIAGKDAPLADAIDAAAQHIKQANLPLFGGLATDVEGMRAAMSLAERAGGVVDHALSEAQYRNFKVLQSSGWIMSTMTETRNRADLIIIVGTDVNKLHQRFFERVVCPPATMFDSPFVKRTVVFIGKGLDTSAATGPRIGEVVTLPCPVDRVGDILEALRAELKGAPVQAAEIAGVPGADVAALADRCRKASYGVVIWAPPGLNFPNADLTVHLISETIKDLNQVQRFAGLALGGNEGAVTSAAVCAWQCGYPLRVSFASGKPDYDPTRYSIGRMLANNEGDLLVWTSSFNPEIVPPETRVPMVVLGTPGLKLATTPAVFIPVGTPGVDHAGRLVRVDNVVSLPLRNLKRSSLPGAATVLAAIEAAI